MRWLLQPLHKRFTINDSNFTSIYVCTRVLPDGRGSLHLADSMSHVGIMSIAMPQKGNHTSTNYTVNYGRIVEVNVQELH